MKRWAFAISYCLVTCLLAAQAHASSITGMASYYKMGKRTANGEHYYPDGYTCAHRNLPFGTWLKVTNLGNHRWELVRVNDRGPFIKSRVLDLSMGAARELDMVGHGVARISFEIYN